MRATFFARRLLFLIAGTLVLVVTIGSLTVEAQDNIGGHIGFVLPLVTHADGSTTTIGDNFSIGFPIGVTFKGKGHFSLDLEMVPQITDSPRNVALTIDPGGIWSLSHGVSIGGRVAFDVNSSRFGFIPLINKSWKFKNQDQFFKAYFVEADLPVKFDRPPGGPNTNPVTFAVHFGLGF